VELRDAESAEIAGAVEAAGAAEAAEAGAAAAAAHARTGSAQGNRRDDVLLRETCSFPPWDPPAHTPKITCSVSTRRTENSEGLAVRAQFGASPLLQKHSKFSSALTEVRLICGSAGHVLEPVWENFLRNL
jgi:hypothetical protein